MTWGWDARGALPATASSGTTGGGSIGTWKEAAQTKAWPRYEAEYLKRALMSDRYKYDTEGLDEQQKGVYLDRVVANYKNEADECLKAEFEQWLQGTHPANDANEVYQNMDGKPVRRWVFRSPESQDANGGYKVGQARAGWKHTPWGRASLTHLPGVRDYLRDEKQTGHNKETEMQLLAELGPQNIEQAWVYFKHWVKGRPLTDAVCLPGSEVTSRSDFGRQMPHSMHEYNSTPNDRQPGVYAADAHAHDAAVARPGSPPVEQTTESEDRSVQTARNLRVRLENLFNSPDLPSAQVNARDDAMRARDAADVRDNERRAMAEERTQETRQANLSAPGAELLPALGGSVSVL